MTTVVSNSSGRQGGKPVRKNQSSNASHSAAGGDHITQKDNEKFQPTAEQMRIASLMTDKRDADSDLKPKIDQIVELTGATRDDAAIALYDCDNDTAKAVEMILDGEALESEWQSTGKKKKQKQPAGSAPSGPSAESAAGPGLNGQKNGDDRKFDKSRRDRNNGFDENGSAGADYKSTAENGRPMRGGKRDGNFKPRGDRRGGGFAGGPARDPDQAQDGGVSGDDSYAQAGDGPRRGGFGGGRGGRGGAFVGRGRGAPRGGRGGRGGARTFGTRPQGTDKPSDEFLGSIDTWTNEPKPDESGVGTMKVGNWSDFNGQEWSSENWNESDKAFSSPDKNGPAGGSGASDVPKPVVVPNPPTQMSFLSAASKSIEKESQQQAAQQQAQQQQQSQPAPTASSNFSSIASSVPSKRPEPAAQQSAQAQAPSTGSQQATSQPSQQQTASQSSQQQQTQVTAGRALLNQIQQPQPPQSQQAPQQQPAQQQQQQAQQQQPSPQQPSLKPVQPSPNAAPGLGMNMYNKNATESIKSLVGLSGSAIGEPLSGDMTKQMSTNTRINAPAQQARVKPAESAVEMPTNDVHNISLRFGSLDFNSSSASGASAQPSFSTLPQESSFEAPSAQKTEKNLNSLMEQAAAAPANPSTGGYRSNAQSSGQKSGILSDVLSSEKISSSTNYSASTPKKNDYMMGGYGKNYNSSSDNYNNSSSYYQPQQQQQPNFQQNYYNPAQNQFNSGSLMQQPGAFNSGSTYGGNTAGSVPAVQQQQQAGKDGQQSQSNVPTATSSASNSSMGIMSSTNTTNVLKNALPATGKGVHNNNSSNPSMPPGVQGFAHQQTMVPGSYLTPNANGVPVPYMPFPAYQGMADPFRTESFNSYPSADMKFNRGSDADMSAGSSQTVQSMAGQGAHNQYPTLNPMGPMSNMSPFGYYPNMYGFLNPQQFNTHSYGMPPTTNSLPTGFAGKNNAAYGSNTHSYNSAYDSIGSTGSANASANASGITGSQNPDYIKSGGYGSQQMPHNKSLQTSGSASELSAGNQGNTNGQPMYNKSHSQMSKNFEKQNPYQQNNQFMGGNNGLGSYGSQSNYLLTQPPMNLGGDQSAAGGPQGGGSGTGHRGSMKGNPGGQSGQGYGAKLWN